MHLRHSFFIFVKVQQNEYRIFEEMEILPEISIYLRAGEAKNEKINFFSKNTWQTVLLCYNIKMHYNRKLWVNYAFFQEMHLIFFGKVHKNADFSFLNLLKRNSAAIEFVNFQEWSDSFYDA